MKKVLCKSDVVVKVFFIYTCNFNTYTFPGEY